MALPTAWSYSSAKLYQTCPKKYHHLKVLKDVKEDNNAEHLTYGKTLHEAAEFYVRDGTPLPAQFSFIKQQLDELRNIPGEKLCEHKMGLTEALEPCDFFAKDCWFRGVADLLVIDRERGTARIIDYKSGKSSKYADPGQLELMALAVFKHFPEIKRVKAGLLFVVANDFRKASFQSDQQHTYWRNWIPLIQRIERSHETGVWNPNPSGLCRKWCPVLQCPHNGLNGG